MKTERGTRAAPVEEGARGATGIGRAWRRGRREWLPVGRDEGEEAAGLESARRAARGSGAASPPLRAA